MLNQYGNLDEGDREKFPRASLTDQTVTGMSWLFSGTGAQMALKVVVLMVMARLLAPADFGLIGAAMVIIGLALDLSRLGIGPALVQRADLTKGHLGAGLLSSMMLTIVAAALLFLSAPFISGIFRMEPLAAIIRTLSFVFPVVGFGIVSEALLQRDMQFKSLARIEVLSYALGYGVVGVSLAMLGMGVWALVMAQIGQAVLRTILLVYARPPLFGLSASIQQYKDLYGFGLGYSMANSGQLVAYNADNFVVGRWLGAEALGIYTRAFQVLTLPTKLFGRAASKVLFPAMSSVQDQQVRLKRGVEMATSAMVMIGLPTSVMLILLAPDIVWVVLGSQWEAVVVPFQILAVSLVFRIGIKICSAVAEAKGAVYSLALRQWFYGLAIFMGAWIGHFFGLGGVAAGVSVAIMLSYALLFHLVVKISGVSSFTVLKALARHTVIAAIMGFCVWTIVSQCRSIDLHQIVTIISAGVTAFLTIMALFKISNSLFGDEGNMLVAYLKKYSEPLLRRFSIVRQS